MKNKSGIYALISKSDPSIFYIGTSENLQRRKWSHLNGSRKSSHKGILKHQNKYGATDLMFKVIRYCPDWQLQYWEQYYLSEYNPILNLHLFASTIDNVNLHRDFRFDNLSVEYFNYEKQIIELCQYINELN